VNFDFFVWSVCFDRFGANRGRGRLGGRRGILELKSIAKCPRGTCDRSLARSARKSATPKEPSRWVRCESRRSAGRRSCCPCGTRWQTFRSSIQCTIGFQPVSFPLGTTPSTRFTDSFYEVPRRHLRKTARVSKRMLRCSPFGGGGHRPISPLTTDNWKPEPN
jgi:hypothetical protein